MRRKREEMRHQSQNDSRDCNGDNMTNVIDHDKTQEECAKRKKTMLECVKRQRQTKTEEQGAKRKKTIRDCMTRQQQT